MRFNHATLIVSDFAESVAFFRSLGFVPIVLEAPRYARFRSPDSDTTLSIEVTGAAAAPPTVQIYLECDDVDAAAARAQAAGIALRLPPTDMDYLWREAWLHAPDGHDIRLFAAGRNRLDPPWKVSAG